MNITRTRRALLCLGIALIVMEARPVKGATIAYSVGLNTSSVSGTTGFLDFQFNPGNNTSVAATAQIVSFNPDSGSLSGAPMLTGSVVGALPGTVTFMNSTPVNELFQGFTFGSNISFVLVLSGPAVGSPNIGSTAGTEFGVGLFDNTMNPILTNQGSTTGFVAQVDINLDGTTTATAFPTATGGPPVATLTPVAVPEPATILLLGLGLAALTVSTRASLKSLYQNKGA